MKANIVVLAGDGIGPEVVAAAREALDAVGAKFGHGFSFDEQPIGGAAIDATGQPLPAETIAACRQADGILLGAVGGPKWSNPDAPVRPEQGLLALRSELGLYANLRPVKPHPSLIDASPLRPQKLDGVDLVVVRELTGGIYFGAHELAGDRASDECAYTRTEIERIVRRGFDVARGRRKKLTSVDKANVLATSRLWRRTVDAIAPEYPDIAVEHILVDAAAMYLLDRPAQFDVIVTENLFGDILTDEASMLAGSMGLLPSASLSDDGPGVYEPIHGSAPDIAGRGVANPCAAILSAAMLLRHSLDLGDEAAALEAAVNAAVTAGIRTPDIRLDNRDPVSTTAMTAAILERL